LTNGVSTTTNYVGNPVGTILTASNVCLDGLAVDAGRIADISITHKYYDDDGNLVTLSPQSVALYGNLPGLKYWTNNFQMRYGTNIMVPIATDSAGNVQTKMIPKTYFVVKSTTLNVNYVKYDGIGDGTSVPGPIPALAFGFGQAAPGAQLEIGRKYQIKAVPSVNCIVTNWTDDDDVVRAGNTTYASLTLTFIMKEGLILNANFMTNPIIAANVAGLYNGIFHEMNAGVPNVTEESSGSMFNVQLRTNRLVVAPISVAGRLHVLVGFADLGGHLTQTISRTVYGRSNLVVDLQMDWTGSTKQLTGTISSTNSAGVPWTSPFTNDLATNYLNHDARYTMVIPPAAGSHLAEAGGSPAGYGYALITNDVNGKLTFVVKTADGASVSQVVSLSKDGKAPIHINMYPRKAIPLTGDLYSGELHGWLDFNGGAPVGDLSWLKMTNNPASLVTTNYPHGFTNQNIAVISSVYDPNGYPGLGGRVLNLTSGTFSVAECNVGTDATRTWTFGLSTANVITRTAGATNFLSGSLNKPFGLMTITFRPTGAAAVDNRTVRGVVLQNTSTGYGAFNAAASQTGVGSLAP
jgi:hypothetical protein